MEDVKECQRPEGPSGAEPKITPEMIQNVFTTLESKGLVHYMKGGAYIPTEKGWKFLKEVEPVEEIIEAYGSKDISAIDDKEISILKSKDVNSESVIAIRADKACVDISDKFKEALKTARKVLIIIECGGEKDTIIAFGSPALELTDEIEIVIRKNDFIDSKTFAILADKAANELKESLKEKLKTGEKVKITLKIE